MCTMSMITDVGLRDLRSRWKGIINPLSRLDRAREYDKAHNQPDCELSEKQEALKKIARECGVEIVFPA